MAPEQGQNVTLLISLAGKGDQQAAERLLPLVYDELRKLARQRMTQESPGQTLQPTALVHEAYIRLVGDAPQQGWNGRGHFFGAAALAMRRILVERARQRASLKRGGDGERPASRETLSEDALRSEPEPGQLLDIDAVLSRLEKNEPRKGELVMLRYFAGLTLDETAAAMAMTLAEVRTEWAYARAWMHRELMKGHGSEAAPARPPKSAGGTCGT